MIARLLAFLFLPVIAAAHQSVPVNCEQQLIVPAGGSPLDQRFVKAGAQLEVLKTAVRGVDAGSALTSEPIAQAAEAALTKHHAQFAGKNSYRGLDLPRHMAILGAIAEFDAARPRYSLYKIKRVIEGRYSLREYTNCR